jgi:flagellar basal-body rod modification protein FlgD
MTTTNPISLGSATAPSTASAAASAAGKLANTYDSFLKLLTTQLQHQDPLAPMDSNQFVSQLVAFAGVEQQIAQNSNLEKLIAMQSTGITSGSLGYMGKTVEALGEANQLANGEARFGYSLPTSAATVTLAVLDGAGRVVYSAPGDATAGAHGFTWNGKDSAGNVMADGEYHLRVSAVDTKGEEIEATTSVIGKVTAVEQSDDGPVLSLGVSREPQSAFKANAP